MHDDVAQGHLRQSLARNLLNSISEPLEPGPARKLLANSRAIESAWTLTRSSPTIVRFPGHTSRQSPSDRRPEGAAPKNSSHHSKDQEAVEIATNETGKQGYRGGESTSSVEDASGNPRRVGHVARRRGIASARVRARKQLHKDLRQRRREQPPFAAAHGQPPPGLRKTSADRRSRFCSLAGTTMCSRRLATTELSNACDQDTTVPTADAARTMVKRYFGSEAC